MYDWKTELQIRAEDPSYGVTTNKVCASAVEEIISLRAQVERFAEVQEYEKERARKFRAERDEAVKVADLALRQWCMYAELVEGRDLKSDTDPEAEMFRSARATLEGK